MSFRHAVAAFLMVPAAIAVGCGGDDGGGGGGDGDGGALRGQTVTVWSNEGQPDRVAALKDNLAEFTQKTGIKTRIVALPEDQLPTLLTNAAAAGKLPDVIAGVPAPDALSYAQQGVFNAEAAQQVVDELGADTFSQKAIDLVSQDGSVTAVPSDGWGQLLIYRRDLFDKAGLDAPATLEDVRAAAQELNGDGRAGIVLATAPGDGFTSETFEHVALANGCQLVDQGGTVTIDAPPCVEAMRLYGELAREYSVEGNQDIESTRGTYFAGRAAMIFWSPFILDGMAGLRDDTRPSCPQCESDAAFLAKNSGLVGPLAGDGTEPAQFGVVSTFAIPEGERIDAAKEVVKYLMTDGYVRWLGLSPQGKYPVRMGDAEDPEKFVTAWNELESGVDRKAPLSQFYDEESIQSLGEGVENFTRWAFPQGQGALLGALSGDQPIADAVAKVVNGADPAQALQEAKGTIEEIKTGLE